MHSGGDVDVDGRVVFCCSVFRMCVVGFFWWYGNLCISWCYVLLCVIVTCGGSGDGGSGVYVRVCSSGGHGS